MMITNGVGAMMGSFGSGWLVQHYTDGATTNWQMIWFLFAGYALCIAVLFAVIFRYRHQPVAVETPAINDGGV